MDNHPTAMDLHTVVWTLILLIPHLKINLLPSPNTLSLNDAECHRIIFYLLKHSRSTRTVTWITLTSASYDPMVSKTPTTTKACIGVAEILHAGYPFSFVVFHNKMVMAENHRNKNLFFRWIYLDENLNIDFQYCLVFIWSFNWMWVFCQFTHFQ